MNNRTLWIKNNPSQSKSVINYKVSGNNIREKGGGNMNKFLFISAFLTLLILGPSIEANALTFDTLPKVQTSKQWSVEIGKSQKGDNYVEPKKGVIDIYSFRIKNIGQEVDIVSLQLFRDDSNSNRKSALFGPSTFRLKLDKERDFSINAFPISAQAKELEVVVTWKENGTNRELKETFVFK
jgi:hypothetical protein